MAEFYAVRIDDVRDMFGADPALAEELTEAARIAFPQDRRRRRPFLPLMRRTPEFTVDPNMPTSEDLSILLAGGYVAPDRVLATWRLFRALLAYRATAGQAIDITAEAWEEAEFDLSRHGLDSHYSLRRLAERQLGIPLRPAEGELCGYAKHVHVVETVDALRAVRDVVEPATQVLVDTVLGVCDVAAEHELDVVVVES